VREKTAELAKTLAQSTEMYRTSTPKPGSVENFELPFGGQLSDDNRWVKLADLIPWEELESEYAQQFSAGDLRPSRFEWRWGH
jgi:hypothetical protein